MKRIKGGRKLALAVGIGVVLAAAVTVLCVVFVSVFHGVQADTTKHEVSKHQAQADAKKKEVKKQEKKQEKQETKEEQQPQPASPAAPAQEPVAPAPAGFDITSPASLQVLVNKRRPLNPLTWEPADLVWPNVPNPSGQPLRAPAANAMERMFQEAQAAGVPFYIRSGYRSFALQTQLFNNFAASEGLAEAERISARPGFSEHQTGLAADLVECSACGLSYEFGGTPQGVWLRNNAPRFGFILRYNQGSEPVVGYVFEPWHFRYVGEDVALAMQRQGILNYEDYLGQPAAPTY